MDLVNLAYNGARPSDMPVGAIVGTAMFFGLLVGLLIFLLVAQARLRRAARARFKGPALTGTAQVLSAYPAGGLAQAGATWRSEVVCRIGMRVQIPGRPPYDVTVTRPVNTWRHNVQPGWTYAVQVDSANPENVRFDYRQPIT